MLDKIIDKSMNYDRVYNLLKYNREKTIEYIRKNLRCLK